MVHDLFRTGKPLKIAIIGSRKTSFNQVKFTELMDGILDKYENYIVISGGANGIDLMAEKYCNEKGIQTRIIKPDYRKYGRGAPFKRNDKIIQISDKIIAIWNGESKGTEYIINNTDKLKLLVIYENQKGSYTPI